MAITSCAFPGSAHPLSVPEMEKSQPDQFETISISRNFPKNLPYIPYEFFVSVRIYGFYRKRSDALTAASRV
jgi:hypothetical protein